MKIDIRDVRRILAAHLRREVANEAIALGKILTDLARLAENAVPLAHKKDVLRAAGWTEHKTGNWSEVEGATDAMPLDRAYGLVMSAPRAAPFDVPPKVHTYGNPGDPGDGKLRIRKASRRPSDQDADDTVGVMQ